MPVAPDLHQGRVDLDRVDPLGPLAQRDGDVVAGARADDEHVVVGPGIRVREEVERRVLGDLRRPTPWSAAGCCSRRCARCRRTPSRCGSCSRATTGRSRRTTRGPSTTTVTAMPAAGSQRHDRTRGPRSRRNDHGGQRCPRERRHPQERQPGEGDDAEQRAADVEAVGVERLEGRERAGHLLGHGAEGGDGEQEDHGERQPAGERAHAEVPDQRPAAGPGGAGTDREGRARSRRAGRAGPVRRGRGRGRGCPAGSPARCRGSSRAARSW